MAYDIGTARGVIEVEYNGRGVKQAQDELDATAKKGMSTNEAMRKVSTGFVAAGATMVGGLALGVNAAANFEQRISAIAAVSGATGGEIDKLRKKALQLGKDTQFSASESAQAMEELVKAGLSVEDVLNGAADATVALAAAGSVDMPTAATISANAMNQFNLTAEAMTGVVDSIAGAANASAIDVTDFGQSLQQVGAVANLAGVSFEDTATAIALMGNAGIKGSDAGTSLKSMFQRLQPTTTKQAALFRELGILTLNNRKAFKDLAELGVKPASQGYKDIYSAAQKYFQQQGLGAAGTAQNTKAVEKYLGALDLQNNAFYDAKGNLKDMASVANVLQDATKGMTAQQKQMALQTLFGSDAIRAAAVLSNAGAKGFDKMSGSMKKVSAADVAAKRMDNFKGSLEQMKGSLETAGITAGTIFIPMLRKVVDGVTGLLNSFLNLPQGVQTTIVILTAVVGVLLLVVGGVMKLIIFINTFRAALVALRAAAIPAWLATLGPIALVVLAIAAVVAIIIILWKKSETFRNIVTGVWNAIKSAISAVVNWFRGVPGLFGSALDGIKGAFSAVLEWIKSHWRLLISIFLGPLGIIIALVTKFWPQITGVFRTGLGILMGIWKAFWGVFGGIITAVFQLIVAVIQLWLAIIMLVIRTAWLAITTLTSAIWNGIVAIFQAVWGFIVGIVTTYVNMIRAIIGAVWNGIKAVTSAVWNGIVAVFNAVWGRIGGRVTAGVNAVKGVVTGAWNAVKSATSTAWNALAGFVQTGINKVMTKVNSIKGKVTGALSGAIGWLKTAGKDIIQGLLNGIEDMIGKVTDKLHSLTSKIKKFPHLSPYIGDTMLIPNGRDIIGGLITGITQMEPQMVNELHNVTRLIVPATTPPPPPVGSQPTATPGGSSGGLRLIDGELRLDKSGRAFISGVAADTMDGASEVDDLLGRMG